MLAGGHGDFDPDCLPSCVGGAADVLECGRALKMLTGGGDVVEMNEPKQKREYRLAEVLGIAALVIAALATAIYLLGV